MSSITAPMPRALSRAPGRWLPLVLPLAATVGAVWLAAYARQIGNQPIRSDALNYYQIALQVAQDGPFAFDSALRTYGYPYFLALLIGIVGPDPETVRTAGFVIQLVLFLAVAWFGAGRLARALGMPAWTPWLYTSTALCPFILIHSIQMLTDVLSTILVYLVVVLSLPASRQPEPGEASSTRRTILLGMLALFFAGLAVIVRPANLVVLPVPVLAWLYRSIRTRDLPWRTWPLLAAMLVLPFLPQMALNQHRYGVPHPLLLHDLYASNTIVGVQVAKYGTLNVTGVPSRLHYFNPFRPAEELTVAQFMRADPLGFAGTLVLHGFALFDHDFPFAYVSDVNPWYRWPLSIPNYIFLLSGFAGLLVGLRWPPGATAAARERARVTILLLGMTVGAMTVIYLPSAVESRFSLPMYPLLAAPFVLAVVWTARAVRGRPVRLAAVLLLVAAWVGGMAATSLWLDRQAPLLVNVRAALAAPKPPAPSASYQVQVPEDWEPGQMVAIPVRVTNTGQDTWSLEGFFNVALRVQFLATKTEQHRALPKGARVYVNPTGEIGPGQSAEFLATVETPTVTGRYTLNVTMIRTGIDEPDPGFEQSVRVDKGR